jgi:hypothetical protein
MVACDALDLLNCGFISVIDYSMLLLLIMHAEEPGVFFLSFQYSLVTACCNRASPQNLLLEPVGCT